MNFRLSQLFTSTFVFALWLAAWQSATPLPTLLAGTCTVFLFCSVPRASIVSAAGSTLILTHMQTCSCPHLSSTMAIFPALLFCGLAWYGARKSHERSIWLASVAIAIGSTTILSINLQDLLVCGHSPVFPNSSYSISPIPDFLDLLYVLSLLTAAIASIISLAIPFAQEASGSTECPH